jgi:hypothetical protein
LQSLRLWELCEASNYALLPYAGGWLDQPQWFTDDVESLLLLAEWHRLNAKLPKLEGKNLPVFGAD